MIATIVKNQWFSGSPLPLNEWFGKHPLEPMEWQWFFSMATIGTNGMAMVFNGLQPLVKQWDGNDPSLWSSPLRRGTCKRSLYSLLLVLDL